MEVRGDRTEPGVVLCDGLGCDGFAWKYLKPALADEHRVVHWHYRGHGRSGVPREPERYGLSLTCDDLTRVMDEGGLERAVIFGHSMGVQVALEFHRRFASRVAGLVLLCGSYGHPLDTFHDHTVLRVAFPYLKQLVEGRPTLARRVTRLALGGNLAVDLALRLELNRFMLQRSDLVPYFDHLAHMDPVAFVRTLATLEEHSAWDHLPHLNVPTLVIGGEHDSFTPVWLSRRMAEAIPGAELLIIPGGSHAAPLEMPDLVVRRVQRFLRARVKPGR